MTRVLNRLLNAGRPRPLPESLEELDRTQKRRALNVREVRMKTLIRDAREASTADQRAAVKREMEATAAELKSLREAGAQSEPYRATIAHGPASPPRRKRTQAERAARAIVRHWSLPNELAGLTLHPENLSEEEGEDLHDLLELRHFEGVRWDAEQTARFRALVEKLAGWACFAELDAQAEIERLAEEVRLESLPRRVEFAEIGSVHLAASVFAELRSAARDRRAGWTIADVGSLAVILSCFEARDAGLIEGGRFEDVDGEQVLVGKGRELRFSGRAQPPSMAIGASKVEVDERWLEKSGWLRFAHTGSGRIEVRLGPKAKALREGRPS